MCARRSMLMFGSAIKQRVRLVKRNIYNETLGRSSALSASLAEHKLPEPPEKDEQGKTLPHDHGALQPDDIAIRRISDKQISDYPNGVRRISSLAFKTYYDPCEGMSVDLERFIRESGQESSCICDNSEVVRLIAVECWVGPRRQLASRL